MIDSPGPGLWPTVAAAFCSVVVFLWLGTTTAARVGPDLQSALAADARVELAAAGLPLDGLNVDGRDVTLSGALASSDAFDRARDALAAVRGIRSVVRSTATETAAAVRLEVTASEIILEGRIPNQESRESLEQDAKRSAGSRRVVERLVVEPGVDQPLWIAEGGVLVDALVTAGGGVVRVERSVLSIRGTVATGEVRNSLVGAIRAAFPDLEIVVDVEVAEVRSEVQSAIDQAVASRAITFDRSGTSVTSSGAAVLDEVARVLVHNPNAQVDIVVHGALTGQARVTPDWRRDRAERVRDYLVRRGVRSDRVRPLGAYENEPMEETGQPRVTFMVIG